MAKFRSVHMIVLMALLASLVALGSSPVAAQAGTVVINELHYHPPIDPDLANDVDDFEFLELHNPSGSPVDISGWTIADAVTLTIGTVSIPAGGFVIVSPNAAATVAEYGVAPVAEYTGKLANGGEPVTLLDSVGAIVDTVTYDDAGAWPTAPDGDGPSLELRDSAADNALAINWAASDPAPTPAAPNTAVPVVGAISNIVVSPANPGAPVTVSATIAGATSPQFTYKVGFTNDVVVAMSNTAGDQWSATVPGQTAGELVRYRIDNGAISDPASDDTITYRGYVVNDPDVSTTLPDFRWFIDPDDYDDLQTVFLLTDTFVPTVIAYDGVVYDGVVVRIRGGTYNRVNYGKKSYEFEFPSGHDFIAPDILPYPIDQFALNGSWVDRMFGKNYASWNLFETAGFPTVNQFPVHVEQNGDFYGMAAFTEKLDGEWREGAGLDGGEFYKADGGGFRNDGGWEVKRPDGGSTAGIDAVSAQLRAPASASKTQFLYDTFDIPNLINYMAVSALLGHSDQRGHNFYMFNDTDHTQRWQIYPWDLDLTFGILLRECDNTPMPDLRCVDNPLFDSVYEVPELEAMYWRRVRSLYDGPFAPTLIEDAHAVHVASLGADTALENAAWGRGDAMDLIGRHQRAVAARRAVFTNESRVPSAQAAAPNIVINELVASPAAGNAEFMELYNAGSVAVDLSGWTVDGISLTIPGGTIIPPAGYVILTDDVVAFDASTSVPSTVVVQYSGGLKGSGETVTLATAANVVVDVVTYSNSAPWPAVAEGYSLELVNPSSDNAVGSAWGSSKQVGGTPGLVNDPAPRPLVPTVSSALVNVDEGNSGTTTVTLPVTLSQPTTATVTVDWTTVGIRATAGTDFVASSGTVTFVPGDVSESVSVEIVGDTLDEADLEYVAVVLSNATNAVLDMGFFGFTVGLVGIHDDDPRPVVQPGTASVLEGNSGMTLLEIPVTLSAPSHLQVIATWRTYDFGATSPDDFTATSGTVVFDPGTTSGTARVEIVGDVDVEPNEGFFIHISAATNALIGGFYGLGTGQILDDDSVGT